MDLNFPNFDFKALSRAMMPNPVIPNIPDPKVTRITSAIDNIQNINRLKDLDNLYFQIEMKKKQRDICKKRLKSIISTLDIKIGIILSLVIIIVSVIIPFLILMFQDCMEQYQRGVFIYLIISFIFSMISMSIYLLVLCLKK